MIGAWVLAGAAAWVVGLALQGLGEIVSFIRYYPKSVKHAEWERKLVKFRDSAKPAQAQDFERFVVVKEACGNAAVAISVATIVFGAVAWGTTTGYIALAMGVFTVAGLAKMHIACPERGYRYLNTVIGEVGDPPAVQSEPHNNTVERDAPNAARP